MGTVGKVSGDSRKFRPRAEFLVLFALATGVGGLVLHLLIGTSLSLVFLAPIGGTTGYAMAISVTTSGRGIRLAGHQPLPWNEAVVTHTRWGESLRPVSPKPRGSQVFLLSVYAADWRNHALGEEIGRWAPHLTTDTPPS